MEQYTTYKGINIIYNNLSQNIEDRYAKAMIKACIDGNGQININKPIEFCFTDKPSDKDVSIFTKPEKYVILYRMTKIIESACQNNKRPIDVCLAFTNKFFNGLRENNLSFNYESK